MLNRRICCSVSTSPTSKSLLKTPPTSLLSLKPHRSSSRPSFRPLSNIASSSRQASTIAQRRLSSLALRAQPPSSSLPDPEPDSPPDLSDHEWEIRTGRAIFVLQETLPEFFDTGLITSINKDSGTPQTPAFIQTANINFLEQYTVQEDDEPIYSPNIRLSYTPPLELPPPFPKTFHIDGIQLYIASSSLIRHTMNALYAGLTVSLTKMVVNTPSSSSISDSHYKGMRKGDRQKSILLRQAVTGIARVSGKPAEWEIESTYTFSPSTGLIHEHIVNSIQPAPHQAVYDSLRSSFGKLLGFEWGVGPRPNLPNGAACKEQIPSRKGDQER